MRTWVSPLPIDSYDAGVKRTALISCLVLAISACTGSATDLPSTSTAPAPTTSTTSTTSTPSTTSTTLPPTTTTTEPPLSVAGEVVDAELTPVPNARVAMGEVATITGPDGLFDLEVPGGGTLVVTRPGWTTAELAWAKDTEFARVAIEPLRIRGIRVDAGAAGDDGRFESLLEIAGDTAVNAFVFDTKQEDGKVLYDSTVEDAQSMGAVDVWYDPAKRLDQAHGAGLYAITRIVVFEDPLRAGARPEEKLAGRWIDPRSETAWDYNIALAVEACELGFDEVQFDYVRFPAGQTATVSGQLSLTQDERVAAIESFLGVAREALQPMSCAVSADIFSIVVSMPDDQGLGQRPEELSRSVDALSPMVYPSHYSPGWLGFADPNDHPYEVTAGAIDDALVRLTSDTILRPWLQAFWWSNDQIRQAIQAAEDRDVGWLLWNVRSNFDRAAIPTDSELTP